MTARQHLTAALSALSVPRRAIQARDNHLAVTHPIPSDRRKRFVEIVGAANVRGVEVRLNDVCVRAAKPRHTPNHDRSSRA